MFNLASVDNYSRLRTDDFMREVENDRLVNLAVGPGRPIRTRIATWLVAIAERIEDRPRATVAAVTQ